jgi:hypothetical protein
MDDAFLQDIANLDTYDFNMFGTQTPMPKGDLGTFRKIRQEVKKLTRQYNAYETYSQQNLPQIEMDEIERIVRSIADNISRLEQLHVSGEYMRNYQGQGIILKQKLKSFEISNDGYGVEVDKLFTRITKKTLVDVMKQLGETQAVTTLMKKTKLVLTNYFMSKYATKYHTGSKAVADNRPKKKETYDSPQEKRQAEYFKERNKKLIQERFEQSKPKLPRPPPVRRGKKSP